MSAEIGWYFPHDEADQWDGFNDSGIATFAGRPIKNLARESIQNALDAGGEETVNVDIRLQNIDVASIPNKDELVSTLTACQAASPDEGHKAQVFFDSALDAMSKHRIKVLEISDFNTSGMKGPCNNGTSYFAFMKATGQSKKQDSTAGGSWGIGKFAPYAVSSLRTLYVSTVYQDVEDEYHQYTQGKSILMSHDFGEKRLRGIGFWGVKEGCQPVVGYSELVPSWISRITEEESISGLLGSKLSILGFIESENWRESLVVAIVENFFGAIFRNKLSVNIDDTYSINKESIDGIFTDETIVNAIEKLNSKDETSAFYDAQEYLHVLSNDHAVFEERSQQTELGHCRVRILIGEGMPRKVSILRNGMLITDNLSGLKSFSNFKEFIAVVECMSAEGNSLLREMEPPKHDDFEPERLATTTEKAKGRRALKNLSKWVRDMLKRHAKDPVSERTELDELRDFFGDDSSADQGNGEDEINPFGVIQIRARPIKRKSAFANASTQNGNRGTDTNNSDGRGSSDTQTPGGSGSSRGHDDGGAGGGSTGVNIAANDIRSVVRASNIRTVFFTPIVSGPAKIRLKAAGADSDYDISIVETSEGAIENGSVFCDLVSGNRMSLDLKIQNDFTGAIKVVANEV